MKRAIAVLLSVAILCCGLPALAHKDQSDHDEELKRVLFGDDIPAPVGKKADIFQAIADAAALCIDQFSTTENVQSKKNKFDKLNRREKLSMRFEEIDLKKDSRGMNISASTHRRYTHLGWNWNYTNNSDNKFWKKRKKILQETVQKELFGNSNLIVNWFTNTVNSLTGQNKQCEAFCELVYYVHLLGDHLEGDSPGKLKALMPLVRPNDTSDLSIIPGLKDCLQILFADQKDGWAYTALMNELDSLRLKAEELYFSKGGINTKEDCATNKDNAEELLSKLGTYIPKLLEKEDFFKQAFLS